MTLNKSKNLNIGFFTQTSTGAAGFHDAVWSSMIKAAKKHDVNLLVFSGGAIENSPYDPYEKNANIIYDLVNKDYVDGLVINGIIGNFISKDCFSEFCSEYSPIPVISIIGPVKGFPDVHVNNKIGMENIILHLIDHHGYKKLGFIKGAQGNLEAEERFNIYKKILKEKNIPFDPDLIFDGNFTEETGEKAALYFIKETKKKIDAVISSNDAMAFGVINGFHKLGKKIPHDIAVVGFDNTNEASVFNPALTTVNQPFDKISNKAIELLCEMIEGKEIKDSIAIDAQLIIRQSCGCFSKEIINAKIDENIIIMNNDGNNVENINTDEIINLMINKINIKNIELEVLKKIIKIFINEVNENNQDIFITEIKNIMHKLIINNNKIYVWHNVINTIREYIYILWKDKNYIFKAENLINQARVLISGMVRQAQGYKKIISDKQAAVLREVDRELITSFEMEKLKNIIKIQLKKLKIPSCFIIIYKDFINNNINLKSYIYLCYNENRNFSHEYEEYDKLSLPPKTMFTQNTRFTYNINPLFLKDNIIGYVIFECGPEDGVIYSSLQSLFSSSIMSSSLLHHRQITEKLLKEQSNKINELIKPMIESINNVTQITREKIGIINNLINLTKENSEKLNSTNLSIKQMGEKIYEMFEKIKIIDDISATVNILALNTSIEASHAGQYGKGFSIIAAEIRKLSNLIKENTKNISVLLKDIDKNLNISQTAGNNSLEAFNRLESDVIEVSGTLTEITKYMEELSNNSSKILSLMTVDIRNQEK